MFSGRLDTFLCITLTILEPMSNTGIILVILDVGIYADILQVIDW